MEVQRIDDAQRWDNALLALPNAHALQGWAWGAFKSRHGWSATRLLFQERDQVVAAASVLRRKLPLLPVSVLYVPKGPVVDWTDRSRASRVLAELEDLARAWRAISIKVDPDVYHADRTPEFSPRPACAQDTAGLLSERGWRFSSEQIQFRNTVLLDLVASEDELLAGMKQKTRYNVRLAMRRGVEVRTGTEDDLSLFYGLYAETAERDGFPIRPAEYYYDAWRTFLRAEQAHLLLAEVEGDAVAGLLLFTFGPMAWYMYGASSDRHRNLMPNNLLQWEAIRCARSADCRLYDLWGAPDELDESDPMWGVVRFKLGLGGELAEGLGAWDFPVSKAGYWLYTELIPRYVAWLRGRAMSLT
jgi:lipid II:glycine glycyltransferase (peptidoglycan interpeptide bridge formation enzyme)